MERLFFEGTNTLTLEDSTEVKLDYYLVEELRKEIWKEEKNKSLFGIKIVRYRDSYLEAEYTEPISYSRDMVERIVHKLWKNEVTLVSMLEVVDDLVSEYAT